MLNNRPPPKPPSKGLWYSQGIMDKVYLKWEDDMLNTPYISGPKCTWKGSRQRVKPP